MQRAGDNWAEGDAYNAFMGRWSQAVAGAFLPWLAPEPRLRWLDIGCGTGALSRAVVQAADPEQVIGCDPSAPFITHASAGQNDPRLIFQVAGFEALPQVSGGFGVIVSGLVLNFLPDPVAAIGSMLQRSRPGTVIAAYVWDYSGRMDFLRIFWDSAVSLDPSAVQVDEGRRFPLCHSQRLEGAFAAAGLSRVKTGAIDIPSAFDSFSDYWEPFLAGTGPAPNYVASLTPDQRNQLTANLQNRLEPAGGGKIELIARAWAVRGEVA